MGRNRENGMQGREMKEMVKMERNGEQCDKVL